RAGTRDGEWRPGNDPSAVHVRRGDGADHLGVSHAPRRLARTASLAREPCAESSQRRQRSSPPRQPRTYRRISSRFKPAQVLGQTTALWVPITTPRYLPRWPQNRRICLRKIAVELVVFEGS